MTGWAIVAIGLGALTIAFSGPLSRWAGSDDAVAELNQRVLPWFTKARQTLAGRAWLIVIGAILIAMGAAALV